MWDSEIPPRGQNSRSSRRLGQALDHDYWHWGGISLSHVSISWMIVFVTLFYITLKKFWQLSNLTFKSLLLVFSHPISISQNILSVLGFSQFEKKIITVWHMLPIHMGKKWFTLLPAYIFNQYKKGLARYLVRNMSQMDSKISISNNIKWAVPAALVYHFYYKSCYSSDSFTTVLRMLVR